MSELKTNPAQSRPWRWPVIVVVLLTAHVVGMLSAVTLINHRTRTLGLVENYYDQAVRWDERQALVRASRELGWQVKVETATRVDEFGKRGVKFAVTDHQGRPVADANLEVTCVHPAHADVPAKAELTGGANGEASGEMGMKYEGFYDFAITVTAGGKKFVANVTQWVSTDAVTRGAL